MPLESVLEEAKAVSELKRGKSEKAKEYAEEKQRERREMLSGARQRIIRNAMSLNVDTPDKEIVKRLNLLEDILLALAEYFDAELGVKTKVKVVEKEVEKPTSRNPVVLTKEDLKRLRR